MAASPGPQVSRRPLTITLIGALFVIVGITSLARLGLAAVDPPAADAVPYHAEAWWVAASAVVALAGGALLLAGRGWARWILVAWLGFHVGLSLLHEPVALAIHAALFAVITWLLFRRAASAHFRGEATSAART